jgi:UDP-N-acetylglucosamine--N-acetylmuramyl-(pentapeptide) pyrophosphoryl-undecaprenol N-acetylglucosamine transferase
VSDFDPTIRVDTVVSGKLRRYHHLTFLQHFIIPSVLWPNIRDVFLVLVGIIQSIVKLIVWRPDVVFTKGGFVCLPVGWAAQLLRIPVVVHDSDAHPGLTNRLLAKRATAIATGAPLEYYSYPAAKTTYVGIPIGDVFRPYDDNQRRETKKRLEVDETRPLVVVTGGGLGARVLNDTVALNLQKLLEYGSVILISGADQYDELRALTPQNDPRYQLHAFVSSGMADILGAADVVVSRAGATTLLELAALAKPTILVPNGRLTGGHQLKNAKVYSDKEAVIILDDEQFRNKGDISLVHEVRRLLQDAALRKKLSANIHAFARPHAASDMAALVLKAARRH